MKSNRFKKWYKIPLAIIKLQNLSAVFFLINDARYFVVSVQRFANLLLKNVLIKIEP